MYNRIKTDIIALQNAKVARPAADALRKKGENVKGYQSNSLIAFFNLRKRKDPRSFSDPLFERIGETNEGLMKCLINNVTECSYEEPKRLSISRLADLELVGSEVLLEFLLSRKGVLHGAAVGM